MPPSICSVARRTTSSRRSDRDLSPHLLRQGLQERPQAHLVPGLRRLRRPAGRLSRAGGRGPARARDRLRHRLLQPHPRLHDRVRLQHRARPRAAHRPGHQARQPRPAGPGGGRRRRRLLHRRRPRAPRHPPQPRHHLHRDGQPDLRPHQGTALAHQPEGPEDGHLGLREPGESSQSASIRARLRRPVRRAGHPGRHGRARASDRGGDPLPGFLLRQRAVALRDVRRGGGPGEGAESADEAAEGPGA